MEKIRKGAIENSQLFTRELEHIKKEGITVFGENYAQNRYPQVNNKELSNFLNKKSIRIGRDCPVSDTVFSSELADKISEPYYILKELLLMITDSLNKIN